MGKDIKLEFEDEVREVVSDVPFGECLNYAVEFYKKGTLHSSVIKNLEEALKHLMDVSAMYTSKANEALQNLKILRGEK